MKWLTRIIEWLKGFFVKKTEDKRNIILSRLESKDKQRVLLELHRDNLEAIATWQIRDKSSPDTSFFIHLDLIYGQKSERELSKRFTHRFTVVKSTLMSSGKSYDRLIWFTYADFQGDDIDPNRFAKTIVRSIALEILDLPPIDGYSWNKRLVEYPWQESLRQYSHKLIKNPLPRVGSEDVSAER